MQQDVNVYLSKLGRSDLSEEDGRRSIVIIDSAINLEHMGDIIERAWCPRLQKVSLGLKFSEDGHAHPNRTGAIERDWPRQRMEPHMSDLSLGQNHALDVARILMVPITLFEVLAG